MQFYAFVTVGRLKQRLPGRPRFNLGFEQLRDVERKPFSLGKKNPDAYGGKVVVLVNEYTQSQAEFTTMALQAAGAIVIGLTTAGADGDVSNVQLPGNLSTGFSGLGVYYPDGTETQQVGIAVDIRCEPTIKGVREGRDEILERAIRFIEQGR